MSAARRKGPDFWPAPKPKREPPPVRRCDCGCGRLAIVSRGHRTRFPRNKPAIVERGEWLAWPCAEAAGWRNCPE